MDFQNKKTIIEPKDGFYVIHTQIYDLSQYTKLTLDCIKDDLYNFCRNENIIIKYVISFSKNENNNEIMDDVGDINILLKSKMINGLYAELYNYLFMEYDKWDFYIGAKRQLLKELNFTIDVIPYDDYFDKIEQEKENKNIEEKNKEIIPKDNGTNRPKKRGKNARKKKVGKNKRKKDNKKKAIDEVKDKFNIGKETQYESAESCTIGFYLIHRTSYNALYGANEEYFKAGGRSLYEVVISKNISPKDRILELYKKVIEIGGTNVIVEPMLQYKLNGIRSRILIPDIETLEKNMEDILDTADYYDRIIFKLDGCICYLNVKHILGKVRMDRMLMESREDDSWKNTKARY